MFSRFRIPLLMLALLLLPAPAAFADWHGGRGHYGHAYRGRTVVVRPRYVAPRVVYVPGRFYAGRGYFYGNRFWARPYFGVGAGIPFGYGYRTPRGCGYVDSFGRFYPAPCYGGF